MAILADLNLTHLIMAGKRDTLTGRHNAASTFVDATFTGNTAATVGVRETVIMESAIKSAVGQQMRDWTVILSPGEQQRLGIARVLYHRPAVAFMDECTSAVSEEAERQAYALLRRAGVTAVSVGHRASLRGLHERVLTLEGPPSGDWEITHL